MTKHYKIAVPIFADEINEVNRQSAEAIKRGADILEFRLDRIKDLKFEDISFLRNNFGKTPKIFTNRHPDEAGNPEFGYKGSEYDRIGLLRGIASAHTPDFIDIEHKHTKRSFRPISKYGKTQIIVSYHDFKHTPGYDGLRRIYDEIAGRADCDIVKIATMVAGEKDNENLFRLIEHASKGGGAKPIVAVGMGELGTVTRYEGPARGSLWTFGALCAKRRSAPGQPSIEELRNVWNKN